jgi:hypothetical protein
MATRVPTDFLKNIMEIAIERKLSSAYFAKIVVF